MKSVLQDWVMELGLRMQGTILGAMRGCDLMPKEHVSKTLTRALRCEVLNSHAAGGPVTSREMNPPGYIEWLSEPHLDATVREFCKDLDPYPLHYVMHLAQAAEVVGYFHPSLSRSRCWQTLYVMICRKLHMQPESREQCFARLNATDEAFREA